MGPTITKSLGAPTHFLTSSFVASAIRFWPKPTLHLKSKHVRWVHHRFLHGQVQPNLLSNLVKQFNRSEWVHSESRTAKSGHLGDLRGRKVVLAMAGKPLPVYAFWHKNMFSFFSYWLLKLCTLTDIVSLFIGTWPCKTWSDFQSICVDVGML